MWCIVRSRVVGMGVDDLTTLSPVGPFDSREDALVWLESHGYGLARADGDDYWRVVDDPFAIAEVMEMEAGDG